ncbi:hypothetical protein [Devosia sp. 2618]|uniref:hypothetical protein n=1 Tax=Devosia sp. 2618 TaxID=3156454 RepID=UPI0033995C8B
MTDMSVVDEASTWADWLEQREHRGPGDTVEAARSRASRKHKLPESLLWSLRYRKPKRIWADLYKKLELAVAAEVQSQEAHLAHEIAITRALVTSEAGRAVVEEAAAFLAAPVGPQERASAEPASPAAERAGELTPIISNAVLPSMSRASLAVAPMTLCTSIPFFQRRTK